MNPNVQTVQNMYGKGGSGWFSGRVRGGWNWPSYQIFLPKSSPNQKQIRSQWEQADRLWKRYFENCCGICFRLRLLFLQTDRILLPSPDFGREKHCQKCPSPNFCQRGVSSSICNDYFTFGPITISIFVSELPQTFHEYPWSWPVPLAWHTAPPKVRKPSVLARAIFGLNHTYSESYDT